MKGLAFSRRSVGGYASEMGSENAKGNPARPLHHEIPLPAHRYFDIPPEIRQQSQDVIGHGRLYVRPGDGHVGPHVSRCQEKRSQYRIGPDRTHRFAADVAL